MKNRFHHRFTSEKIKSPCDYAKSERGSQYSILRVQCSTVRRYWSYIVVWAKPFTIQRGERLVVGVQPKADDRALDGSTFTTLHSLRPTYVTYSEKMKRLQTCEQRQRSSKQKHTEQQQQHTRTTAHYKSETITLAHCGRAFSHYSHQQAFCTRQDSLDRKIIGHEGFGVCALH